MLNEVHCFIGFRSVILSQQLGMLALRLRSPPWKGRRLRCSSRFWVLGSVVIHLEISGKARQNCRFWSCVMFSINIHHPIWGRNFEPWRIWVALNMESAQGWTHRGLQRRLQEVEEQAGFGWMGICFIPCGYGSIPILGGWTSINPSYFDVNYRGIGFWPIPMSDLMLNWPTVPPMRNVLTGRHWLNHLSLTKGAKRHLWTVPWICSDTGHWPSTGHPLAISQGLMEWHRAGVWTWRRCLPPLGSETEMQWWGQRESSWPLRFSSCFPRIFSRQLGISQVVSKENLHNSAVKPSPYSLQIWQPLDRLRYLSSKHTPWRCMEKICAMAECRGLWMMKTECRPPCFKSSLWIASHFLTFVSRVSSTHCVD